MSNDVDAHNALFATGDVEPLGRDLLRGADQIAGFLFGDPQERRKVYHLAETSRLPVFRLGSILCARRSTILAWIEAQESLTTARPRADRA